MNSSELNLINSAAFGTEMHDSQLPEAASLK